MGTSAEFTPPAIPATLEWVLRDAQIPLPPAILRALATAAFPSRDVSSEALGRIAHYAEESFLRHRKPPRFAWVLNPDGTAPTPRIWALGEWRLSRRIRTDEGVEHWRQRLAMVLSEQMLGGNEQVRAVLGNYALETASMILGPVKLRLPGSDSEWAAVTKRLAAFQHPTGPAQTLSSQDEAAKQLEARGLPGFSLYFGAGETVPSHSDELPPQLRLPHRSEPGIPFDDLILQRAGGDRALAREVTAFIQEWGLLIDERGDEGDLRSYAERWRITRDTASDRIGRFRELFPSEQTPHRLWTLLWSGSPGGSVFRLISAPVVESSLPPTVINHFTNCLTDELRRQPDLAREVQRAIATFEESDELVEGREQRRFLALCDRSRLWCSQVLAGAGEQGSALGLLSIEPIFDEDGAAYAAREIGRHRRALTGKAERALLRHAQQALKVAATLDAAGPPGPTAALLPGVELAARALAQTTDPNIPIDTLDEARITVRALEQVR